MHKLNLYCTTIIVKNFIIYCQYKNEIDELFVCKKAAAHTQYEARLAAQRLFLECTSFTKSPPFSGSRIHFVYSNTDHLFFNPVSERSERKNFWEAFQPPSIVSVVSGGLFDHLETFIR